MSHKSRAFAPKFANQQKKRLIREALFRDYREAHKAYVKEK